MRLLPTALAAALFSFASGAHAHGGHAAVSDSHWHATDSSGFLLAALLAGLALWLSRGE